MNNPEQLDDANDVDAPPHFAGGYHARLIDESVPFHIISRVFQGRHILRPDAELNDTIVGVVGRAQTLFPRSDRGVIDQECERVIDQKSDRPKSDRPGMCDEESLPRRQEENDSVLTKLGESRHPLLPNLLRPRSRASVVVSDIETLFNEHAALAALPPMIVG